MNYFKDHTSQSRKQENSQNLFDKEYHESTKKGNDGEKVTEIEDQLLQLSSEMKEMASLYGVQIKEDSKIMDKIGKRQNVNKKDISNRTKELDKIANYSALGFFRLLILAIAATIIFFVTLFIIFIF